MKSHRNLLDPAQGRWQAALPLLAVLGFSLGVLPQVEAQTLPAEIQSKVLAKLGFGEPIQKRFNRLFVSSGSRNVFTATIESDDGSSLWQARFFVPQGYLVKQRTETEQGRFNWQEYGQLVAGGIPDLQPTTKLRPYLSVGASGGAHVRVARRVLDSVDYVNRWQLNNLDTWSFTFTYHFEPELPELPKLGPFKGQGSAQINPATGEFDAVTKNDVGERFGSSLADRGADEYSKWLADSSAGLAPSATVPATTAGAPVVAPPGSGGAAAAPSGSTSIPTAFARGDSESAWELVTKVLDAGNAVSFDVCHERALWCDMVRLTLSTQQISLTDRKGKSIFAAAPADVKVATVEKTNLLLHYAYIRLEIGKNKYNLDPSPFSTACPPPKTKLECPGHVDEMFAIASVIGQAIKKVAGRAPSVPPAVVLPPAAVAPAVPGKPSCSAASDLGYALREGTRVYTAKGLASRGGAPILFLDEQGALVQGQKLLQSLAAGAWVRGNVLADARVGGRRVSAILGTSQAVQRYEVTQDLLARTWTEALEAAVTSGASLEKAVPGLVWGFVRSQLASAGTARTVLVLASQVGLQNSLAKYKQLEVMTLPLADAKVLDVAVLEQVRNVYAQAQAMELPNAALATALMPKSASDLTDQALQSMLDQLVSGLPRTEQVVTLRGILDLQDTLATLWAGLPALQAYSQNLTLVRNLLQANGREIASWAQQAATDCTP